MRGNSPIPTNLALSPLGAQGSPNSVLDRLVVGALEIQRLEFTSRCRVLLAFPTWSFFPSHLGVPTLFYLSNLTITLRHIKCAMPKRIQNRRYTTASSLLTDSI
jgi:hypothetical protein